jgi:hypothetical protein
VIEHPVHAVGTPSGSFPDVAVMLKSSRKTYAAFAIVSEYDGWNARLGLQFDALPRSAIYIGVLPVGIKPVPIKRSFPHAYRALALVRDRPVDAETYGLSDDSF